VCTVIRPRIAIFCVALLLTSLVAGGCSTRGGGAASSKPKYGAFGLDVAGEDKNTKPGDDFFRFANGAWLDRTEIPADKPGYSLRLIMSETTERRLHELMQQDSASASHEPSTKEGKVGAFYKSFMDEARVESLGVTPLEKSFAAIRAASSRDELAGLMGRGNLDYEGTIFGTYIDIDVKEPKRYAVTAYQAGLGLPDRDYYLQPAFAEKKAAYQKYAAHMLQLANWPDAEQRAADIVAMETAIANASWTRTQQRDPNATYNPMSIAELQKLAPGFAWKPYLESAGLGSLERIVVSEKSAFPKIAAIYARTPLETLKAWEAFQMIDNAAPYLSKPFADAFFDFRGRTLLGQQAQSARWKRAVHAVAGGDYLAGDRFDRWGNLGWSVGELYSAQYFPPEAKAKIEALVLNLKAAYRTRIEKLDWMSPETRAKALQKLDTYRIKVGYPDKQRDITNVVIRDDDLAGNAQRAGEADWAFYVGRLSQPVDVDDWGMTPQTNDAYNGSLRDIVFPAGILQPPMFDANADPAINYGAAGGVIGHELTHGFDDEGRKFDADGKLADWWSPADAKEFEARAAVLGAQYSKYEPLPGSFVNGALTMGENIADLGGLTLGLEAYHQSLKGQSAPVLDGLTGDQRVFLGWAQAWRGKVRDDAVRRQVVSDPHSPRQYRVNGVVRNLDAWYDAFGVKEGDKLYLAPSARVRIW
jgi:putative endopeptidase